MVQQGLHGGIPGGPPPFGVRRKGRRRLVAASDQFARGEDPDVGGASQRFLGGRVKEAQGLDGVPKKFNPAGLLMGRRKEIHDPSPHRELAGALHHRHLVVAQTQKAGEQASPFDRRAGCEGKTCLL